MTLDMVVEEFACDEEALVDATHQAINALQDYRDMGYGAHRVFVEARYHTEIEELSSIRPVVRVESKRPQRVAEELYAHEHDSERAVRPALTPLATFGSTYGFSFSVNEDEPSVFQVDVESYEDKVMPGPGSSLALNGLFPTQGLRNKKFPVYSSNLL